MTKHSLRHIPSSLCATVLLAVVVGVALNELVDYPVPYATVAVSTLVVMRVYEKVRK